MKTQKVYLDTSVIGGCFDSEFALWSNGLFSDISNGIFVPATSDVVSAELFYAPIEVKDKYREFMLFHPENIDDFISTGSNYI